MGQLYGGLDAGSRSCWVVAMDRDGVVSVDRGFETTEANLIEVVGAIPGVVHVALEAGELAGWIRNVLRGRVTQVTVCDPKRNAWIAKDSLKGDPVDARKLADLLRTGLVHEVYYPDDENRAVFKMLVQHYDKVTRQKARLKNQIKARFRMQGVIERGAAMFTRGGRKEVLKRIRSTALREAIGHLYRLLDETTRAQVKAEMLIKREAGAYEEIARFQELPGIALIGASRFSGYIQTPHRFSSKRRLWRYCQLGITDRTSDGKPLGRQALDRNGNGVLKDVSYRAFLGARHTTRDNAFKRTYRGTLQRTHNATHARLTTQRKIMATMWAMWRDGTRYQDDKG